METLIIIGAILTIVGIIGSIVPVLPGPVLSFVAIFLLYLEDGSSVVPSSILMIFGVTMLLLIVIDYVSPVLGAKFFGASRYGFWGSIIGAVIGIVFFPPLGIFLGAFVGAILGELAKGKDFTSAFKSGVGAITGSLAVIVLQTFYSIAAAIYFFAKVF